MTRDTALVLALLTCACAVNKSDLDETFEWMDNTYNPPKKVVGSYGHGHVGWYDRGELPARDRLMWGHTYTLTRDRCRLTIKSVADRRAEAARTFFDYESTFQLRDIDPASVSVTAKTHYGDLPCEDDAEALVRMNCDHSALYFKTRNEAGLITEEARRTDPELTGAQRETRRSSKTNSAYLEFDDVEYGKRFAKAFIHAIELCGGKPSKF